MLAAENDRLSNSEFMNRAMDDMLPEEVVRGQYVEVSVYPGYDNHDERTLPQIYVIDDNTVVLYCMREYFLPEKSKDYKGLSWWQNFSISEGSSSSSSAICAMVLPLASFF